MPKLLVLAVVVAGLAAGCSQSVRAVGPMRVASHADELLRDGEAHVHDEQGRTVTVRADDVIDVRIADAHGLERPARITVRTMVAGCVDGVNASTCLAARVIDAPVVRRTRTRIDGDRVAKLVGVVAVGSLAGYCSIACDDGTDDVKRGAGIGLGIGAAFLGALVLVGISGH